MHRYDYIIVGSGLAGLYASYRASLYGKVALITKSTVRESNSYYAQGGIAAVTDEEDRPAFHFDDTITAGRGLCDYNAVDILVNEGPHRIVDLVRDGMKFDMLGDSFALGLEGGHHMRRILHAGGDVTGMKITNFMIEKVLADKNIILFENHTVLSIIQEGGKCYGVRTWNSETESEEIFIGNYTFLASGGASAIFKRTTNPHTTTGDGIALAYEAECKIADMEFVQFHPTALYTEKDKSFLISEAVRGEGAQLLNLKGERFMPAIHELAELAPRDVVARSIFRQILQQDEPYVHLSLKHIDPERIKSRFPNIFEKCRQLGIDMTDKIPVAPAAHYMVGGVRSDVNGRTNIENLYVCGELASTGIMGANRLASNSLLECLVFGYRAVEDTREISTGKSNNDIITDLKPKFRKDPSKAEMFQALKVKVSNLMNDNAGIIRNEKLLSEGLEILEKEKEALGNEKDEYYTLLSYNLITVAELIIKPAIYRKESRGGHYREDYPHEENSFIKHIIQQKGKPITAMPVDDK